MLSSIQTGYRAIERDLDPIDLVLVCPVDFPSIQPGTVSSLIDELERGTCAAVVPSIGGTRGHPVALAAHAAAKIHSLSPEIGLRQLKSLVPHCEVEVVDPGILRDLDTWAEYLRRVGDGAS